MPVRIALLAALLLGLAAPTHAVETPDRAAARAHKAHAAGDKSALTAIANAKAPDTWVVVEALMAGGHTAVAQAVATSRKRFDRAALLAYVSWREKTSVPAGVTQALVDAQRAPEPAALLERIEPLLAGGRSVSHVMLAGVRTRLIFMLRKGEAAIGESMYATGEIAKEIGWHTAAFMQFRRSFDRFYLAKDGERLRASADAMLGLAETSGDADEKSQAHGCMAHALISLRELDSALDHARKSFDLAQSPLLKRNQLRTVIIVQRAMGNTHAALRQYRNLKEMDLALDDQHGAMITDSQIANFEARLGHSATALARIERVLEYMNENGRHTEVRGTHHIAAVICRYLHDPQRMLEHLKLARAAEKRAIEAKEPAHFDPFQLDKTEAIALSLMDRHEEAMALNRKLVAKHKVAPAIHVFDYTALGSSLAHLGKHEEAAKVLEQAVAMLTPDMNPDVRANVYNKIAFARMRAGKYDEALEAAAQVQRIAKEGLQNSFHMSSAGVRTRALYGRGKMKQAADAADEMLDLLVARSAALPDQAGARMRSDFAETVQYAVEATARAGNARRLFVTVERINSVALRNRLGAAEVVNQSLAPELRAQEVKLQEAETQAVAAFRRAKDKQRRKAARKVLNDVRKSLDRHRARMHAEQAAAAQVIDPAIDSLGKTQKRLAKDEALVIYAKGHEHLWALVVTSSGARIVKVGRLPVIVDLLDHLVLEDPEIEWERDIAKLRKTVVSPLQLPGSMKRVTVVPTGAMAFVPYAVLFGDREVTLLPSATTGRLLAATPCCGKGTLAVGDPKSADGRRLPESGKEAQAIGDEILIGEAATEAAVGIALKKRERWRAVHLACHGLIDPVYPLRSALSLTPADRDDGLWTVSELLRTRVPADLAVLGSCSTGRGKSFDQEGVLGFVHAFFVAGARQVIVSLWDVDDAATSALMQRFHTEWKPKVSPAVALQRAQAWVRKQTEWSHPAYWAAWQIWGPR